MNHKKGYVTAGQAARSKAAQVPGAVMILSPQGSGMTLWLTDSGGYSTGPPQGIAA